MVSGIWHAVVYQPLYNVLVFFIDIFPGHSVGLAIIILTVLVKLALFPLTGKSIKAQRAMKELEPELKAIREKHKDDKQAIARLTMELYQKRGVSPFSGCLPMLIQIPIIIGLYMVFMSGLKSLDVNILYSFVPNPEHFDMHFLLFDLAGKSATLAGLAGVSQYFQTDLSLGKQAPLPKKTGETPSFQEDFTRSMQLQMRYVLPVMISFIAYSTSAGVALYWTTSNLLSIVQELLMRRGRKNEDKNKSLPITNTTP